MVISIALFGFAVSGTFLSLIDARKKARQMYQASQAAIGIIVCLYSLSAILSFLALNHLPLDYFRLPVEPIQSLYLLAAYLLLALPFFFSGLIISLAYTRAPEKTGFVYFSSMAGSACGAILPVPLLPLMGEGRLIIISTLIPLIPVIFSTLKPFRKTNSNIPNPWLGRTVAVSSSLGIIVLAVFLLTSANVAVIQVTPSPYKALSQILQFPKSQIVETMTGIQGRVDRIKTPYIRFAPGLSLKYLEALPRQYAVFRDGDNQFVMYDITEKNDARFAEFMLSYSGYHLRRNPENVLLIEHGGGSAIPCAIASRADHISIIVQNPYFAEILRRQYQFRVINQNPRAFLAQSEDRYDIIHVESWGTSIPGTAALEQEHLFTIEAFAEYWNHLTPTGVVIISRKLLLPPSDSLRLWSTAYEALKRIGVENPAKHTAILRNWDTYTLLISKPIVDAQGIIDFSGQLNFDLVFFKGTTRDMANAFNVFDEPYHFEKINQLAAAYRSGNEKDFFRKYLLDVAPQSDRRPFPGRFLKWTKLKLLYESLGSRLYALLMSGEIVIAVVFIEALIVTVCLLVIPLVLITRKIQKPTFSQIIYFFGVGTGFMFVELYFIKYFILLVGDPVISFTLVVSAMLIFTSLGGLWVQNKTRHNIRPSLLVLIGVLILMAIGFELLAGYILRASTALRYLMVFLFLFPVGFLMGLPFPLGMRYILNSPVQRAYAWSVNGCASVLSSIAAAQIAVSFGIPFIITCAVFAYFLAFLATGKRA